MQPEQPLSNTLTNQLAYIVDQLVPLLSWVDLDEGALTTYWQQTERPDLTRFRAELEQNIDWAANRGELTGYKNYVWRKAKPAVDLKEKAERWLKGKTGTSNAMAVILSQYIRLPNQPLPVYKPDPKEDLRRTVSEMIAYLEQVVRVIVDVWSPFHANNTHGTTAKATLPPPDDEPAKAVVHIVPNARKPVYNALARYIDDSEQPALSDLILNGLKPDSPVKHKCQQNQLAYVFCGLLENGEMTGSQINVTNWICENFTPATRATIYDVVRGKKQPAKSKRIKINA